MATFQKAHPYCPANQNEKGGALPGDSQATVAFGGKHFIMSTAKYVKAQR